MFKMIQALTIENKTHVRNVSATH